MAVAYSNCKELLWCFHSITICSKTAENRQARPGVSHRASGQRLQGGPSLTEEGHRCLMQTPGRVLTTRWYRKTLYHEPCCNGEDNLE